MSRNSGSITLLAVQHSTPSTLDIALASLAVSPPVLNTLIATDPSASAITVILMFTRLQCCDLAVPSADTSLNLTPLQGLPHLLKLRLREGEFLGLHAAAHLTNLMAENSTVRSQQSCPFAGSLRKLRLFSSRLVNFHARGVCACTALEWFHPDNSSVQASEDKESLTLMFPLSSQIPNSISCLTSLSDMTVGVGTVAHQPLDWLYSLTTLTGLRIRSGTSRLSISEHLTKLQQLRMLVVSRDQAQENRPSVLELQVPWSSMPQLRCVIFRQMSISCNSSLFSLACVKSLQRVELDCCIPADPVSMHVYSFFGLSYGL